MNTGILFSAAPKQCKNIANGDQTIILSKTRPNIETPFRCYIHCANVGRPLVWVSFYGHLINGRFVQTYGCGFNKAKEKFGTVYNGKVIGEFICDKIDEYECEFVDNDCLETVHLIDRSECEDGDYEYSALIWSNEGDNYNFSPDDEIIKDSCVSYKELKKYIGLGVKTFYSWHISDLKIYDTPKELGEFRKPCHYKSAFCLDEKCEYWGYSGCENFLTRPPHPWCYVAE